jgi:predicted nucleic acid-binding protein
MRHPRMAIDSNVLIYLIEGDADRAESAAVIVDAVAEGAVVGSMSSAGLSEVLVGPARSDDGAGFERAAATIRDLGIEIAGFDASLAEDAAWIRGQTGMDLPDAIHLACARAARATVFITNDRRIRARPGLEIAYLDDVIEAGSPFTGRAEAPRAARPRRGFEPADTPDD